MVPRELYILIVIGVPVMDVPVYYLSAGLFID